MSSKVTHLKSSSGYKDLSKHDVKKYIRKASNDEIRLLYKNHAELRMTERSISTRDVMNVFERGEPEHSPIFNHGLGTWECNIFGRSAGRQLRIGIAIQLMDPDTKTYIVIITTIDLDH